MARPPVNIRATACKLGLSVQIATGLQVQKKNNYLDFWFILSVHSVQIKQVKIGLLIIMGNEDQKKGKRVGQIAYRRNPFWEPSEIKIGKKFVKVAGGMHVSDEGESIQHSGIHTVESVDKGV